MAGSAVVVQDFRREIPGAFDDELVAWAFPPLEYADARGRLRRFEVYVQLVAGGEPVKPGEGAWDGAAEENVHARYWTVTGLVGHQPVRSEYTRVDRGKNVGRKNATNCWTQALRDALAKWRKAGDKRAGEAGETGDEGEPDAPAVAPPMLLTRFDDRPPETWPQYAQVKYDGVRAMVYPWSPAVAALVTGKARPADVARAEEVGAVVLSRSLRIVPAWHIAAAARPFLDAHPTAAVDGELVARREGRMLSLQAISGMARNDKTAGALELVVFDVADLARPALPFERRWELARDPLLARAPFAPAETVLVNSLAEAEAVHRDHLAAGHEGTVLRTPDGAYVPSFNSHRAKHTLKWKPRPSVEFRCVGFSAGTKGKAKGAVMWTIVVPPRGERTKEATMTIDPNMTIAERKAIYSRLVADPRAFDREFKDRALTVEFFDWSEDGLPLQAKAVGFRDWEEVAP